MAMVMVTLTVTDANVVLKLFAYRYPSFSIIDPWSHV